MSCAANSQTETTMVVVTLSVSHWHDKAAGLAEITRVMAPDATLVAADVCLARPFQPMMAWARRSKPGLSYGLLALIAESGLRIERVEPIRSVALIADAALVAAKKPCRPGAKPEGPSRPATRPTE